MTHSKVVFQNHGAGSVQFSQTLLDVKEYHLLLTWYSRPQDKTFMLSFNLQFSKLFLHTVPYNNDAK
jgi:hypothetical protein